MRSRLRNARGSVLVLVAVAIFPLAAMMTFAIDASHWFDYSRNLQNRADAAALAGGTAYGNICFKSSFGDQWTGLQSSVGKWAQQYVGPGLGEPSDGGSNPAANVPYSDASVFATTGAASYTNVPNLTLGSLDDYFVRLNADNYADKGGTNFFMGDFCNADPKKDATDKDPGDPGGMVDVKVTQRQLPNFIPIFNVHPNIEAHARVEIQQIQSETGVRPIAVNDASYIPCVTANFLDKDGTLITSETLTRDKNDPNLWSSLTDAKQVQIPTGSTNPVTVQMFLNNCSNTSPTGIKYDYFDDKGKEQKLGLVYINNWGNPPGSPAGPTIATGGVTLVGASQTQCDPYFQSAASSCAVDVDAQVAFPTPGAGVTYYVRAVDAGDDSKACDPTANKCPHIDLANTSGTDWQSATTAGGSGPFTFLSDSGPHAIHIFWSQIGGSVGGNACKTNANNAWNSSNSKCQGDLGVQQRAFSGINGTNSCNNPSFETGPLQWITVGATDGGGVLLGANAYGQGQTPHLYITTRIVGLSNSGPMDTPICLRVAEQTSHATGFVDCGYPGQPGGPADQDAVVKGCPAVQIDTRVGADGALICQPANNPIDCVQNDPGQSPPILRSFDDLIGGGSAPTGCETNYWPATVVGGKVVGSQQDPNHVFSLDDKRAVVMIITAPTDMAIVHGTSDIPIRDFAVFYVTGWSSKASGFPQGGVDGCNNNDPAPGGAGSGEIWGHWTSIAVPSGLGSSNGEQCVFTQFGNCIAVLTR